MGTGLAARAPEYLADLLELSDMVPVFAPQALEENLEGFVPDLQGRLEMNDLEALLQPQENVQALPEIPAGPQIAEEILAQPDPFADLGQGNAALAEQVGHGPDVQPPPFEGVGVIDLFQGQLVETHPQRIGGGETGELAIAVGDDPLQTDGQLEDLLGLGPPPHGQLSRTLTARSMFETSRIRETRLLFRLSVP